MSVPGPCQFCASIGATCHLDPSRRRQRPYYHVSEEEFRYMTKALEHFLPNIDLNLHSLKEVVRSINAPDGQHLAMSDAGDSINVQTQGIQPKTEGGSAGGASSVTIEEIDALHGELGWLRADSKGTYRKLPFAYVSSTNIILHCGQAMLVPTRATASMPPSDPSSIDACQKPRRAILSLL